MSNQNKVLFVCVLIANLFLSSCGTGQVFSSTITLTPTIAYTLNVDITKESERAPDGSLYPYPKAFLPSERGDLNGIKELIASDTFVSNIFSQAQSELNR